MDRLVLGRLGLWAFTAGIFAWIFPNLVQGQTVNVLTDIVITVFGILAAVGLARTIDGIGTGMFRTGLIGIAVCQFLQNAASALTGLNAVNTAPVIVVILAAIAVIVGAIRWREDDWDEGAMPWLMGGFAGFAFEPIYYLGRTLVVGDGFGGYLPGTLLVGAGAVLAALAFRPARA